MIDEIPFLFRTNRDNPHSTCIRVIDKSGRLYRFDQNVSTSLFAAPAIELKLDWRTIPDFKIPEKLKITLKEV